MAIPDMWKILLNISRVEVFLQGGIGNQLIQQAYAVSLAKRTGCLLKVNPVLLGATWARLRRVQLRTLALPDSQVLPLVAAGWQRWRGAMGLAGGLVRARPDARTNAISDDLPDNVLLELLRHQPQSSWTPMLGYFQRAQAFGTDAGCFWRALANRLIQQHNLTPAPFAQVAVHVRRGDYLLPRHQRIYAKVSVSWQVEQALRWGQQLGGNYPVQLFSDDPEGALEDCSDVLRQHIAVNLKASAEEDFLALIRHRHIVAGNSSFSLVAGQLAACLWADTHTTILPLQWFSDPALDALQLQEWCKIPFLFRL